MSVSTESGRVTASAGGAPRDVLRPSDESRKRSRSAPADATDVAVNTSGPKPVTTLELVRMVTKLAGKDIEPEFVGDTPGKVRLTSGGAFRIAHEEAFNAIGWKPEVQMEEGLRLAARKSLDRMLEMASGTVGKGDLGRA